MQTTIKKTQLLEILRENRGKHRSVFEAALQGYRTRALQLLDAEMQAFSAGRTPELRVILSRPRDQTADYDRVIKMVELDVSEEITLTERESANYLMDQWSWTDEFLKFSSRYAAAETRQAYGVIEDDEL